MTCRSPRSARSTPEHRENYSALRVHAELRGFGHTVNRKRVARLMRKHGIVGRHLRKKKRTTVPERRAPPVDLVQWDFNAGALDEKWCGDITYVQVGAIWLYHACVIDIRSRRVLGYSTAPHMPAESVIDALQAAVAARGGDVTGVIFHADRGSQYTPAAFAQACDRYGIHRTTSKNGRTTSATRAGPDWRDSGLVFTTPGRPLDPANLTRSFLDRAGLHRIRFHDLRRSTATLLLEQGVDLVDFKEALGHAHVGVAADVYAHPGLHLQRQAIDTLNDARD